MERVSGDSDAVSTLTLAEVNPAQSGVYTCSPANLAPAQVSLHIIKGNGGFCGPGAC